MFDYHSVLLVNEDVVVTLFLYMGDNFPRPLSKAFLKLLCEKVLAEASLVTFIWTLAFGKKTVLEETSISCHFNFNTIERRSARRAETLRVS